MPRRRLAPWCALLLALPGRAETVSFANEVMAVVSRAGCNTGGCHGSASGKGGFKLSLWGEDPARDWAALTGKKRVDQAAPAASRILRMATRQEDHEGGERFPVDSESHRLLAEWIRAGAVNDTATAPRLERLRVEPARAVLRWPQDRVRLRVTATFAGGAERDVTEWAVFAPSTTAVAVDASGEVTASDPNETVVTVRYLGGRASARLAFVPGPAAAWKDEPPPHSLIDALLAEKQRELGLTPSPVADDATFLRRVFLDLTGVIPPADRVRAFLADPAPDKRARVADELLASSGFADHWALLWADLLRVEEVVLDSTGVKAFHGWIRAAVAENKPLDRFAAEILAARGSTHENPPANFWRALRNPPARAEAVAQVFLGVRLQCAQCHNHPSDRWTQDDYHRFAGLLSAVDYDIRENKREDENDKNRFNGDQVVKLLGKPEWKDPRTGKPAERGLLDPAEPALAPDADPLRATADWVTARSPLFARAQANRIWFRLFGRGLVDPVDDVRDSNPASHPELLDALAAELAASGYDQRRLIRLIVLSRAYQRAAEPVPASAWDDANHTHALARRLTAEQLLDSIHAFLGLTPEFEGHGRLARAAELPGVRAVYKKSKPTACDAFLTRFGKPPRLANSDLERANDTALAQVFTLVSGPDLHRWLRDPDNRLDAWIAEHPDPRDLLGQLFLSSVGRPPADAEVAALAPLLAGAGDRRRPVEDIAWSLINAKEFLLQH